MKTKKQIELNSFNNFKDTLSGIKVDKFYNYLPDKKLKDCYGVDVAKFPLSEDALTESELNIQALNLEAIKGITYFKQYNSTYGIYSHRILLYGSDKKLYINQLFMNGTSLNWLYNLTFESAPICLAFKKNNKDTIILSSEDKMMIWEAGFTPTEIQNTPIITSMCMCDGNLFCTLKYPAYRIWHCSNLNAENIGSNNSFSGYLSLEDELGNARKVLTFNEDVFVFRDYGITKINVYKKSLSTKQIYASNTKIFSNTVTLCGNLILFLTVDGLYSFDGAKVVKLNLNIDNMLSISNDTALASSLGNNYYLALRLNFEDDEHILCETENYSNNAILIYNFVTSEFQIIRGVDVGGFFPIKTDVFEKMVLTFNSQNKNKLGQIVKTSKCFNNVLPKKWESDYLTENFNTKLFTKLRVIADQNVCFSLKTGSKVYNFTTLKSGESVFKFKICAGKIKLIISSNSLNAKVDKVILDYYEFSY